MNYWSDILNGLKTALFLRKSRTDIEEEELARLNGTTYDVLEKHRKELLRFARKYNMEIVDIFEEVISGAKEIEERHQMQMLLDNVKQNKYQAVLCIHIDRLSRSDSYSEIEKALKRNDVFIVTPRKIYDLNSDEGETSADVDSFIGKMEYRLIKRRLEDGKRRSAIDGKNVSSRVNFGFDKDPITKKLVINEKEASTVRLIYKWCIEGYGTSSIARKLFSLGIKTKLGNDFTNKTVGDIIKCPKYKGDNFYGLTRNKKKLEDFIYVKNSHAPIVDESTWNIANKMLKKRKPKINNSSTLKNPFAGLMKCSECGMTLRTSHSRGEVRMNCVTLGCNTRSSLLKNVEAKFIEGMQNILSNVSVNAVDIKDTAIIEELENRIDGIEVEILNTKNQINVAYEMLEAKVYTPEVFVERNKSLNGKIENLNNIKLDLQKQIKDEKTKIENATILLPNIINAMELYHKSTPKQKNTLLKSFIKQIVYTRRKTDNFLYDFKLNIYLDD